MAKQSPAPAPPTQASHAPSTMEELLARAQDLLSGDRVAEVSLLLDRWTSRAFVALVVGEFKRGKSTLLNALIGEDLLPTGVQPVTAVPTRVRSGTRRRAVARFLDGTDREITMGDLRDYVDESRNPGNRRGVATVDVEVEAGPPPGVVIVDVPGLGSVHRHNTESALAAIPEADAALVVASVDPPIGEAETRLLRAVHEHAARIEVVLNKIDYLDDGQRSAAEDFTHRTLVREGFAGVRVWPVSARDGLRARLSHDDVGWRRSGMDALSAHLTRFFEEERTSLLARSLAKKAGRLVEQETALLDMQRAATERSARDLHAIIETFRARRATAERDSAEAVVIFRRRFDSMFGDYPERAAEAWKGARAALESRLQDVLASKAPRTRRAAWEAMQAAVREAVAAFAEAFLPEEGERLARAYGALSDEIGQAAAERAEAVWRLAADLVPFDPPRVDAPPAAPVPRPSVSQLGSLHLLLDDLADAAARLLPRGAALRRLAAQAREEADSQYGAAVEQARETFVRAYEEHLRELLARFEDSAAGTALAVEAALTAAERRAQSTEAERARFSDQAASRRSALAELRERLRRIEDGSPATSPPGHAGGAPGAGFQKQA